MLGIADAGRASRPQGIGARSDAQRLLANQALIAAFDPLLRKAERADVVGVTSSVGDEPRAFWGAYGSSKAALETLLGAYADETAHTGRSACTSSIPARPAPACASSPSRARSRRA